jgi:hypothetical protein
MLLLAVLCLLSLFVINVLGECPNACSSHGKCGQYDSCICYRNWMSNDCSERVCQFGLAHVDTPLGDLDASSGALTGISETVVVGDNMYPKGTQELFPNMISSDGTGLTETAHYYRECSNKGICDRSSGTCSCFEGYEGSACQRASCPTSANGVCSGHGQCKTISELAASDNNNVYRLWDEDITMGCECDAGFYGADCSSKQCKVGADPLYYDDFQNIRYANYTVQFFVTSDNEDIYGNYSLVFTDAYGEDWQTDPIDIDANCMVIQDRLESLPNDVIPAGSVRCHKTHGDLHSSAADGDSGSGTGLDAVWNPTSATAGSTNQYIYDSNTIIGGGTNEMLLVTRYTLAFPQNPGYKTNLKINKYLDGARPTLFSSESTSTMGYHVFPNGYTGEDTDYVNDECEGVLVGLGTDTSTSAFMSYLSGITDSESKLLKKCLGDSNGIDGDNVDIFNWDHGSHTNPHLIKLVDATQDKYIEYVRSDGSSYKLLDSNYDDITGYPVSWLCDNGKNYVPTIGSMKTHYLGHDGAWNTAQEWATNENNMGEFGMCKALDPPGFYAILIYFPCTGIYTATNSDCGPAADGKEWRLLTRSSADFDTTTEFHVYTSKGTLQQVSQYSTMYTEDSYIAGDASRRINNYYSNMVYLTNSTSTTSGAHNAKVTDYYAGNIDCETNAVGSEQALDCLNKGDLVFFASLGDRLSEDHTNFPCAASPIAVSSASSQGPNIAGFTYAATELAACQYKQNKYSHAANPIYPNMYTIEKISREPKSWSKASVSSAFSNEVDRDGYRQQILLNHAINARYSLQTTSSGGGAVAASSLTAADSHNVGTTSTIYKFYKPTIATTTTTGFNYVGECSNRGICDDTTGLCDCFAGYTGDNCGSMNSLAV